VTVLQRPLWPAGQQPGIASGDASVHWRCQSPAHVEAPSRAGRGGLVVYRGRWGYCDGAVSDTRHEWAETGGAPIDTLIDWAKALDPWRATTVRGRR
jgi:hypothetical protein